MEDFDLIILDKLAELKEGVSNQDTIIYIANDGEAVRIKDIRFLVLSNSNIKEIPDTIGCLVNLQRLDVSDTQLMTLPESIKELIDLRWLDVSGTHLTTLPESIGNLTSLRSLDISNTQISRLPESIGNLIGLYSLEVSNTQLMTLPESIGNLTELQSIDVSGTHLTKLPEIIGGLICLKKLNASRTQITTLPESIGNLTSLQNLNVSRTQLTALPESIGNLTSLQNLNVSRTQLTMLPESIGDLSNLKSLYAIGTHLTTLPENTGKLIGLEKLDVRDTQISRLPESIGNLTGLEELNVRDTQISRLPESIRDLINLRWLDVSGTQLTTLPESIVNLTDLQILDVSCTQLTALPRNIRYLRNLERLNISETNINSIETDLWESHSIQSVYLEALFLERIPNELIKLNLKIIHQRARRLAFGLPKKTGIFIHNLTLSKQPISLFYQKRELIEQYFNEEMVSVNSAKIIFLGDGEVGKTYTLKRLLNDGRKATKEHPYPTQTTHGVLIKPYHVNDGGEQYDIKLWDFGGQQIMHSMHRCFLTERSCYVVMLSTRTDRDLLGQARYWLRTVNSFAPNAPVIVLVNQWTKNLIKVDEYRLREEFKNIKEFLYFSIVETEDEQFLTLKVSIMKQVRQLDCYGMEFPKSWYGLMTDLEKESESKNYISKSAYYRMCFDRGLKYECDR